MADTLLRLANDRRTARFVKMLGLPAPVVLERATGGYQAQELAGRTIVCGAADGARLLTPATTALEAAGATIQSWLSATASAPAPSAAAGASPAQPASAGAPLPRPNFKGAVFDATGIRTADDYRQLYDFFQPLLRKLARNARVVILGEPAGLRANDPVAAAAARGLEGFTRSLAKELGRRGTTANLILVSPDGAAALAGPLQFFCSARCTYVDGQVIHVGPATAATAPTSSSPGNDAAHCATRLPLSPTPGRLHGKVALVTGAARGIGAATAARLAEEGAKVICLDIGADRDGVYDTATRVGGVPFVADVADTGTAQALCDFIVSKFDGLDIVVHNAGITRDKTLANMPAHWWDQVLAINLRAILAIDAALLSGGVLRANGRIVCLSSMGGFAGNYGQTNYAATKAALIGYVAAQAPHLAGRGITANAVAPGFIETRMTAAMPLLPREVGRRMSSLSQGGQPRDVAELIAFLATPEAAGVSGNTIRVCGQGWLGA